MWSRGHETFVGDVTSQTDTKWHYSVIVKKAYKANKNLNDFSERLDNFLIINPICFEAMDNPSKYWQFIHYKRVWTDISANGKLDPGSNGIEAESVKAPPWTWKR